MLEATEQLKRKILALIAKGESSEFEAEALSFVEKAKALMDQYNLSTEDLLRSKDPLSNFMLIPPGPEDAYIHVAIAAAAYLGGSLLAVETPGMEMKHFIAGRQSACIAINLLVPFWWEECQKKARKVTEQNTPVGKMSQQNGMYMFTMSYSSYEENLKGILAIFASKLHHLTDHEEVAENQKEIYKYAGVHDSQPIPANGEGVNVTAGMMNAVEEISLHMQMPMRKDKEIG